MRMCSRTVGTIFYYCIRPRQLGNQGVSCLTPVTTAICSPVHGLKRKDSIVSAPLALINRLWWATPKTVHHLTVTFVVNLFVVCFDFFSLAVEQIAPRGDSKDYYIQNELNEKNGKAHQIIHNNNIWQYRQCKAKIINIQFKIGLLFCGFHNAHYNNGMNTKMGKRVRTLDFRFHCIMKG